MSNMKTFLEFPDDTSYKNILTEVKEKYPDTWKKMIIYRNEVLIPLVEIETIVRLGNDGIFNYIIRTLINDKRKI